MSSGDAERGENISHHYRKGRSVTRRDVAVNDVVLVLDEITPRSSWPLGRVIEVYTNSRNGLVCSVKVKTRTSELVRPVFEIVLLEAASKPANDK